MDVTSRKLFPTHSALAGPTPAEVYGAEWPEDIPPHRPAWISMVEPHLAERCSIGISDRAT